MHKMPVYGWCASGVIAAGLLLPAFARADIALPIGEQAWQPRLFELEGVPEGEAARLEITQVPGWGASLAVGPWRAGRYGARFETVERLKILNGQVRGVYRTEDIEPFAAAIWVIFHRADGRRRTDTFKLAPSPGWKEFAFPIRRPPPDTQAVSLGFGLIQKTEGRVLFTNLSVSTEPFRVEFPESPGTVTRFPPPVRLAKTGRIRLTEHDGAWWLVSPTGQPFYSIGADGPYFDPESDLATGREFLEVMRRLRFNSLAGWTSVPGWAALNKAVISEGSQPLVMFRALESGTSHDDFDRLVPADNHSFPDPFDPRWEEWLRNHVRGIASLVRGEPWFAALFADNEVSHRELYRHLWTPNCSAALRTFLQAKYGDIGALNSAWGSGFRSFDDLVAQRPDPVLQHGPMYEDLFAFSREVVRKYAETAARVIREELPGHIVFSNRLMLDDVTYWLKYLDLYAVFDGIAVNMYPANLSPGLNDNERMILELVHEKTGKPVLISEWSVPALDSGLYDNPDKLDWSYDEAVDTQTERARQAARIVIDYYNMPFVVGAHWFFWNDFDSDKRQANRGLFLTSGQPWIELQVALGRAAQLTGAGTVEIVPPRRKSSEWRPRSDRPATRRRKPR